MGNYKVELNEYYDVREYYCKDLNPEDFLDCENEDELYDTLEEILWDESPYDTEYLERFDKDLIVPDEFINEWMKLKNVNKENS